MYIYPLLFLILGYLIPGVHAMPAPSVPADPQGAIFSNYPTDRYVCSDSDTVVFVAASDSPRVRFQWEYASDENGNWLPVENQDHMQAFQNRLVLERPAFGFWFRCSLYDHFSGELMVHGSPFRVHVLRDPGLSFEFVDENGLPLGPSFCRGQPVFFRATADPDQSDDDNNLVQSWTWRHQGEVFSRHSDPVHVFVSEGDHLIQVEVEDAYGCVGRAERTMIISPMLDGRIDGFGSACQNQRSTYRLEGVGLADDMIIDWSFSIPPGVSPESLVADTLWLDEGRTLQIMWAESWNPSPLQITLQVRLFKADVGCLVGLIEKPILLTSKRAPASFDFSLKGDALLIARLDTPEAFDYRWGFGDVVEVDTGEARNYHLFETFRPNDRNYWLEIKYKEFEACWTRVYYVP